MTQSDKVGTVEPTGEGRFQNIKNMIFDSKGVVIPARTGDERIRTGKQPATIG